MRTWIFVVALSFCTFNDGSFASVIPSELHWSTVSSLKSHLETVNPYWSLYAEDFDSLNNSIAFSSDIERISTHLRFVSTHLKSLPKSTVVSEEANLKRLELLDTLRAYANRKLFPINNHHTIRTPYFVDDYGTACAVGFLMLASGNKALVNQIHKSFNYRWIKDIPVKEVEIWATMHGFTVEELKWIQPSYATVLNARPIGGTDSAVTCFATYYGDVVFAGGDFTKANNFNCNGLVQIVDSTMQCIVNGPSGKVNDLVYFGNTLFAAGEFTVNSKSCGAIMRTESGTEPIDLFPNYEYIGTAIYWFNGDGMLAECNANDASDCHIWRTIDGAWEKAATIHGFVNDIVAYKGKTIAGSFDSITAHFANGDSTFEAHNIARINTNTGDWSLYPDEVDNEVFTLETVGEFLYVGGRCIDSTDGSNSFCLLSYLNGSFQQVVNANDFYPTNNETAIHDIEINPHSQPIYQILFAGNFEFSPSNGTHFSSLATYDPLSGHSKGFGLFDGPVYAIQYARHGLYIGGGFNSTYGVQGLNNICFVPNLESSTSISTIGKDDFISLYPNPVLTSHTLSFSNQINGPLSVELFNVEGQCLGNWNYETSQMKITRDVSNLDIGLYFYKLKIGSDEYNLHFFKQ